MTKTVDQLLDERRKIDAKIKSARRAKAAAEKARQAKEVAALGAVVLEAFQDQVGGLKFDNQVAWVKRIVGRQEVLDLMHRELSGARERAASNKAGTGGSSAQ